MEHYSGYINRWADTDIMAGNVKIIEVAIAGRDRFFPATAMTNASARRALPELALALDVPLELTPQNAIAQDRSLRRLSQTARATTPGAAATAAPTTEAFQTANESTRDGLRPRQSSATFAMRNRDQHGGILLQTTALVIARQGG